MGHRWRVALRIGRSRRLRRHGTVAVGVRLAGTAQDRLGGRHGRRQPPHRYGPSASGRGASAGGRTGDRVAAMGRTATLSGLGVLGVAAAAVVRRHRTISAVAPDLPTPSLWLPLFVDTPLVLAAGRRLIDRTSEPVAATAVSQHEVPGGQDVFVYELAGRQRPTGALLWIHGGGTILGRPETDHELCSRTARDLGVTVVSARYRLAPEHPFPAGLDDCYAAL